MGPANPDGGKGAHFRQVFDPSQHHRETSISASRNSGQVVGYKALYPCCGLERDLSVRGASGAVKVDPEPNAGRLQQCIRSLEGGEVLTRAVVRAEGA